MDSAAEEKIPPVVTEQPQTKVLPSSTVTQPTDATHVAHFANAQVLLVPIFGSQPMQMICLHCNEDITTTVQFKVTGRTHLMAGIGCILGGIFCVWIPYVMDKTKAKHHYCPKCGQFLGSGPEWPFSRV